MPITVTQEHMQGYTALRVGGTPSLEEFLTLIKRLEVESLSWPAPCVLVDMRGVESLRGFIEQFKIGEQAARRLPHLLRIGSLVPEGRVTRTSQTAAQRAGMQLLVFTDEAEAIAWVSGAKV